MDSVSPQDVTKNNVMGYTVSKESDKRECKQVTSTTEHIQVYYSSLFFIQPGKA